MVARLVVFESTHDASRFWAKKWLKDYGVEFEEEPPLLTVEATPLHEAASQMVDRLVSSYEDVCAEAERQGIMIKPYKPLERHVAFVAMVAALRSTEPDTRERYAAILHEAVWAQGLPNANHRSTLNFVIQLVLRAGRDVPADDSLLRISQDFAAESKKSIREKEWDPDPRELKAAHHEAATRAVEGLLAPS